MKRIFLITLCILSILLLASCGKNKQGPQGEKGDPGVTPTIEISDDGYWVINGVKTEYKVTADSATGSESENPQGLDFFLKDDGTYAVAMGNAKYLSKIVIPATYNGRAITEIADNGFSLAKVVEVIIPDSVTSIGYRAFSDCSSLTSIEILDGVTSIGYEAFRGCSSLTSIVIPDSVTIIGGSAFWNCDSLVYNEYDNAYYLGNENNPYLALIRAKDESISSCSINNATKFIHSNAFSGCFSLTSIEIPDSVTSIGEYAFSKCSSLTSIAIPDSVSSIGYEAFRGCSSLTSIVIPDSVTTIGDYAFSGCSSLTSVVIPDGVTSIGSYAFYYCTSLTSIEIPDSVTSIGGWAFCDCYSLTSIVFDNPNGWYINGTAVSAEELANPETAATYLRYPYDYLIWTRK